MILSRLFPRINPLPTTQAPRPLANTPVVLATFPVPGEPGRSVALIEDEFWHTREHGRNFRYGVVQYEGGRETEYTGTDSLRDAQALVWHLTQPALPETSDYADEPDTLPEACYHSSEDEAWWARHEHETPSELDQFLDDLTPDQMDALSDDFGGAFGMGGGEMW